MDADAFRRRAGSLAFAGLVALAPAAARGNGAFPDSETILVPADRPDEILVSANFGLLRSEDAGRTWTWACEQPATPNARLYQLGPAPDHRLFAIAQGTLVYSDDEACGWQVTGGAIGAQSVQDAFVDPTDAARVLAVAFTPTDAGVVYSVLESGDGGASFDTIRYTGAAGELVLGVESARSAPSTVYLALASPTGAPGLARSTDGGGHFQTVDLSGALGAGQLRIAAVDPGRPDRVFLRFIGVSDETLVIADDGGATITRAVTFTRGAFWSFLRTAAGSILAGGSVSGAPALFRSDDGGVTFAPIGKPPGLRALAERDGVLYAATDNMNDGYLEAVSTDGGATWRPGPTTARIAAIAGCVKNVCQTDCLARAAAGQWPPAMCDADPPPPDTDAGGDDAAVDASPDASPDAAPDATDSSAVGASSPGGCACGLASTRTPRAIPLLAALAWGRRRRRR